MTSAFVDYTSKITASRYFWTHLVLADLRAKYRRSWLGLGWSILQPLAMTLLLTLVMGKIFHMPVGEYAPYIFSGLIIWEYLQVSVVAGCSAFINAQGYIKQLNNPLAIYSLRAVLAALINMFLGFIGVVFWVLVWKPSNFGWCWLELLLAFLLLTFITWPIATISAFIATRFRDFNQLIIICMQALWYISPVFFPLELYEKSNLSFLVHYNPIYHILQLFRAPLLHGQWPTLNNLGFVLLTGVVCWLIAMIFIRKAERTTIFYL